MNFFTDPLLNKLRLIESRVDIINEGLSPNERKELDGLYKELAGWGGVDPEMDTLIAAYKKLPKGGSGGAGGAKVGRANPGTKALQHWLTTKGQKVTIDGIYGPGTQAAVNSPGVKGDPAASDMLGVGTAYNVIPGQGLSLNSPRYLELMKKYGYDPKTGDPIAGGAKGGAGAQPATSTNPEAQKIRDRIAKLDPNLQMNKAYIAKLQAQADALEKGGGAAQPAEKRTPAEIQASADLKKAGV